MIWLCITMIGLSADTACFNRYSAMYTMRDDLNRSSLYP